MKNYVIHISVTSKHIICVNAENEDDLKKTVSNIDVDTFFCNEDKFDIEFLEIKEVNIY